MLNRKSKTLIVAFGIPDFSQSTTEYTSDEKVLDLKSALFFSRDANVAHGAKMPMKGSDQDLYLHIQLYHIKAIVAYK